MDKDRTSNFVQFKMYDSCSYTNFLYFPSGNEMLMFSCLRFFNSSAPECDSDKVSEYKSKSSANPALVLVWWNCYFHIFTNSAFIVFIIAFLYFDFDTFSLQILRFFNEISSICFLEALNIFIRNHFSVYNWTQWMNWSEQSYPLNEINPILFGTAG